VNVEDQPPLRSEATQDAKPLHSLYFKPIGCDESSFLGEDPQDTTTSPSQIVSMLITVQRSSPASINTVDYADGFIATAIPLEWILTFGLKIDANSQIESKIESPRNTW
jgi:hypothetical protein